MPSLLDNFTLRAVNLVDDFGPVSVAEVDIGDLELLNNFCIKD